MFLWTRPVTYHIFTAFLTTTEAEAPLPDWDGIQSELLWCTLCILPLAALVGQVYIRLAASLNITPIAWLRRILSPAGYTFLVQCLFADAIVAALLQSVPLQGLGDPQLSMSQYEFNGMLAVFTCRLMFVGVGLALGEAFFPLVLTGGIACGKSTFARLLEECGFCMIDADKIGHLILLPPWHGSLHEPHSLVAPQDSVYVQILEAFPGSNSKVNDKHHLLSGAADKTIDRAKLGAHIFAHPEERKKLNAITHRRIFKCLVKQMARAIYFGSSQTKFVCAEVPLLFESGPLRYIFGMVLCVACSPAQQWKRLQKRNPDLTPVECQKRIDSQLPMAVKVKRSDIVLWNDQDFPASPQKKDKNKEEDTTQAQEKHEKHQAQQIQKALRMLDERILGLMGMSLTKMVLLMVGALMSSTCYKLYNQQ